MAKLIKRGNYPKVVFGSEGYSNLSEFTEIVADSGKNGKISIIFAGDCKRVKLNRDLYEALNNPRAVKMLWSADKLAIRAVSEGIPGSFNVGKGGVIYSTKLAEKIIAIVPAIEFKGNATTRCGNIEQVQENEDGSITVILNFE